MMNRLGDQVVRFEEGDAIEIDYKEPAELGGHEENGWNSRFWVLAQN